MAVERYIAISPSRHCTFGAVSGFEIAGKSCWPLALRGSKLTKTCFADGDEYIRERNHFVEVDLVTARLDPFRTNRWQALFCGLGSSPFWPTDLQIHESVSYGNAAEILLSRVSRHGTDLDTQRCHREIRAITPAGTGVHNGNRYTSRPGISRMWSASINWVLGNEHV